MALSQAKQNDLVALNTKGLAQNHIQTQNGMIEIDDEGTFVILVSAGKMMFSVSPDGSQVNGKKHYKEAVRPNSNFGRRRGV